MSYVITFILSYLAGSIPVGLIVSKMQNKDIRTLGSGNIGTSNTFRTLGEKAGIVVFLGDLLKGFLPALLAGLYGGDLYMIIAAGGAVIGHSYSMFIKFKGGKGIATGVGAVLAMNWIAGIAGILLFVIFVIIVKYPSLSSIIASSTVAVISWLSPGDSLTIKIGITLLVLFVLFRHKDNIKRLIAGKENKLFEKNK